MSITIHTGAGNVTRAIVATSAGNTVITCARPSNVAEGEHMLAIMSNLDIINPSPIPTPPSGWTQLYTNHGLDHFRRRISVYVKQATGSEPADYTWTIGDDPRDDDIQIFRVTGANASTFLDASPVANDAGTQTITNLGITTTTADALVLYVMAANGSALAAEDANYPTGTTGVFLKRSRNHSYGIAYGLATEVVASPGTTGSKLWTGALSASGQTGAVTLAIRPATGPSITLPIDGDNAVTQGQTGVRLIQTNCTGTVASVTVGGASATPSLDTSNLSPWFIADFGNLSVDAAVSATGTPSGNFPASTYATFEAGYGAQRSVAQAYPGSSTSLQLSIPTGSDGDNNGGGTGDPYGLFGLKITLPASVGNGGVVHAQIRQFFPTGFQLTSTQALKWLRFNTKDGAQASQGYNDLYIQPADTGTWSSPNVNPLDGGYDGSAERQLSFVSEGRTNHFWTNNTVDLNTWNEIEFEVGLGAAGTGWAKVWKKVAGTWTLIGSFTGISTLSNAAHTCDSFFVHTYWNGNSPATQSVFIDRVVVHNNLGDMIEVDGAGNAIIAGSVNA